jgi:hypothetical protein
VAAVKAGFDMEVVKSLEPDKPRDRDKHSCFVFVIGDKHSAKGIRPCRRARRSGREAVAGFGGRGGVVSSVGGG